jgi:hypothetical protein
MTENERMKIWMGCLVETPLRERGEIVALETGATPTARIAYVRIGDRRPEPYHEHELRHVMDPAVVDALR